MKEYLGQVLSIICIKKGSFDLKILIDTKENFDKVLENYHIDYIDQYDIFLIKVELTEEGEVLISPDELSSEYLEVYSSIEPDEVEGKELEGYWQKGMILDNLIYDTVNSLIYRPTSTEELELEEIEEEDYL